MTPEFVLTLFTVVTVGFQPVSVDTTTYPNFTTKQSCEDAGKKLAPAFEQEVQNNLPLYSAEVTVSFKCIRFGKNDIQVSSPDNSPTTRKDEAGT